MPLFPPPDPVVHPADLVIDTFGTYLGKKSERMIVRWRETKERKSSGELSSTEQVSDETILSSEFETSLSSDSDNDSNDEPLTHENTAAANGTPADQAAAQLLKFWAQQSPAPERLLPTPRSRLHNQLNAIADSQNFPPKSGTWKERAVPLSRLRSVTVAGKGVTVSSDLIAALVERGISLSFLTGRGDPVAQLSSPGLGGTVQTRRSQLSAFHSPLGVVLAVEFIRGKLRNQKHQLQYSGKYLKSTDPIRFDRLTRKIQAIGKLRKQLTTFQGDELNKVRDQLMGYEGTGARVYWEGVSIVLEGRVDFPGRSTRGAVDPVNSALNYGYGILYGQVSGAIVNAGLEMYAGFLHVDRPGKPALVLDLVEEFRAPIVDRVILAMINQGIDLDTDDHGLTAPTRKLIAHRILERLSTPVPYEGKRWPLGTIIQNQARHLAVAVRGERDYRAFASRW
ncbi:MAG TPA: CRISPR-associated endonuclease Cas1 [Planctomicrobium sp.]|nr:CRISPR-associated endonuclease Cas1 [Planctomicrobium sp.]